MNKNGLCIIITGPSGVGKTTAIMKLLEQIPNSVRLVTTTTRPPREGEIEGQHYYYVSKEEFLKRINQGEFLEYDNHYGNLYGSSRLELEKLLAANPIVFLVLDINGTIAAKKVLPEAVSIFLLPGHIDELKQRLAERQAHTEQELASRIEAMQQEIDQAHQLDYQIINSHGQLDQATAAVAEIIDRHLVLETT